jgi:hypothetical protein
VARETRCEHRAGVTPACRCAASLAASSLVKRSPADLEGSRPHKPSTTLELAAAPVTVSSVTPYSQGVFLMGGCLRIPKQIRTWRLTLRPYLRTSDVRGHPRMRRFGGGRPPLPIGAVDAVVGWQYAILVHSFGGAATTCHMFGLRLFGRRFWRHRFLGRRRSRRILGIRGGRGGRRSRRIRFRRCAVALPNDAEDHRRNHD